MSNKVDILKGIFSLIEDFTKFGEVEKISMKDALAIYPQADYWSGVSSSAEEHDYWVVDVNEDDGSLKITPLPRKEDITEFANRHEEPMELYNDYEMSDYISDNTVGFIYHYYEQKDWENDGKPYERIVLYILDREEE